MEQDSLDHVRISTNSEQATLFWQDSAAVQRPKCVLFRSSLLRQTLPDAEQCSEVSVSLPTGVIQAWLQGLSMLQVHVQASPGEPYSPLNRQCEILNCFKVCLSRMFRLYARIYPVRSLCCSAISRRYMVG